MLWVLWTERLECFGQNTLSALELWSFGANALSALDALNGLNKPSKPYMNNLGWTE
jgi:hypothetical protein